MRSFIFVEIFDGFIEKLYPQSLQNVSVQKNWEERPDKTFEGQGDVEAVIVIDDDTRGKMILGFRSMEVAEQRLQHIKERLYSLGIVNPK